MKFLWEGHRDRANGGYFWSVNDDGPVDATKQGYGHPFVLLAASSAMTIGHLLAASMLADVSEILDERFWQPTHGAIAEEFGVDWTPVPGYRGQNSTMHLTEALMAAYEATGARVYLERAESIADLVIRRAAGGADWRVIEHFTEDWSVDHTHIGNEMFRPSGTTPRDIGWNGRACCLNSGAWATVGSSGFPMQRDGSLRGLSPSDGTQCMAAFSTPSTGTTGRCGG